MPGKPLLDLVASCFIVFPHLNVDEGFGCFVQFSRPTRSGEVIDRSGKFHFLDYSCYARITNSETFIH